MLMALANSIKNFVHLLSLQMLTTDHVPDVPDPDDNYGLRNDLDFAGIIRACEMFLRTGQYNQDSYGRCLEFTTVITVPDLLEAHMENFKSQLHPYRILTFDFEGPDTAPEVLVLQCLGSGSVIIHLAQIKRRLLSDPSYDDDKIKSYFQRTLRPLVQAVCSGDVIVLGSDISEDVRKLKRFFAKGEYFEDIEGSRDLLVDTKWLFAASKQIGTFHSDVVNFLNHRSVKEGLGPIALCTNQYNHKTFSKSQMLTYLGLNPSLEAHKTKARKQWNALSRELRHGDPKMALIFSWADETLTDKQKLYAHLDVATPLRLLLLFAQRAAHLDNLSVRFHDFTQLIDEALRFAAKITPYNVEYRGLSKNQDERSSQEEKEIEMEAKESDKEEEMETEAKESETEEMETQKDSEEATLERGAGQEEQEEKDETEEIQNSEQFLIDLNADSSLVDEMSKDDKESSPKPSTSASKSSMSGASKPSTSKDSYKIPRNSRQQATNQKLIALASGKLPEKKCAPLGKRGEEWEKKQKEIRDRERSKPRRESRSRSESRQHKESRSRDRSRDRHGSKRRKKSKERKDDRRTGHRNSPDRAKEKSEHKQDSDTERRVRKKIEEISRKIENRNNLSEVAVNCLESLEMAPQIVGTSDDSSTGHSKFDDSHKAASAKSDGASETPVQKSDDSHKDGSAKSDDASETPGHKSDDAKTEFSQKSLPDGASLQDFLKSVSSTDDNVEAENLDAQIDKNITGAVSKSMAALFGRKSGAPTMDILERLKEAEEFISAARSQLTEGVFGRVLCDKVLTEFEIEDIVLSQRSVEWAPEPNHFSKYYTKNDPNRLPIRQRFPDEHFQYDDPKSRVQEVDRSQNCRHTSAWPLLTVSACAHCGKRHDSAQDCAIVRFHNGSDLFESDKSVLERFPCGYCDSHRHTTSMCIIMHSYCPDCRVRGHRQYKSNGKMNKNRKNIRRCLIGKEQADFMKKKFEQFSHLGRLTAKDSLRWGFTILRDHECDGEDCGSEVEV